MRRTAIVAAALCGVMAASNGLVNAAEPPTAAPIAVSYDALPPALDLVPFAVVDIPVAPELQVGTNVPQAAVLADGGVVLVDEQQPIAYLVGRDGSTSSVALDGSPKFIVATPGPSCTDSRVQRRGGALEFVAIALTGANAGAGRRPASHRRSVARTSNCPSGLRQHGRRRRRPHPPAGCGDDRSCRRQRRPGWNRAGAAVADRRRRRRQRRSRHVVAGNPAQPRLDDRRSPASRRRRRPRDSGGVYWTTSARPTGRRASSRRCR